MKTCSNHEYRLANGGRDYVSSTLTSRHNCATSVCCVHGAFIESHHEECDVLRAMNIPICDYAKVLQARDALEYFTVSAGKFINSSTKHNTILRDDLVYSLTAFVECTHIYKKLMNDTELDPPKCWLVGAHHLLNKYRSTNEEAK